MTHDLRRCLLVETQAFCKILYFSDLKHDGEICIQMYMDDLGHGINGGWNNGPTK